MTAPAALHALIERYTAACPAFLRGEMGRAEIRDEFILPILALLGWAAVPAGDDTGIVCDVPYRIREEEKSIDVMLPAEGVSPVPVLVCDPLFPLPDTAARELRHYAWNAGCSLAVLTNFGETAIFDATIPVRSGDDAQTARIASCTADQYGASWDRIAAVLSRECVVRGSADRFSGEKRGGDRSGEVSRVLAADLASWQLLLARNIVCRNPGLSADAITDVVQEIIGRILFLRFCEDRGFAEYGLLERTMTGGSAWGRLCGLFGYADDRFGTALFAPSRDQDGTGFPDICSLAIDDTVVKTIITRLTSPASPYLFSFISPETLGQAFLPFLANAIRLTSPHHVEVKERPEAQKAGGASCTPQVVEDFIVQRTLTVLLDGKTPRETAAIRILDPACGPGLFLVGVYTRLLGWHRAWYRTRLVPFLEAGVAPGPEIRTCLPEPAEEDPALPVCRTGDGPVWDLTAGERQRILTTCIFGVDIDPRAVAVTRLLLSLAMLGMEDTVLPTLGRNIRRGNALVSPGFHDDRDAALLDDRARQRVRAFSFPGAFPTVMAAGGFDAVLGEPPHLRRESLRGEKEYLERHSAVYPGTAALYPCFVEQGMALLRPGGTLMYLLPGGWLRADEGRLLRRFLHPCQIEEIIDTGDLCTYPSCIIRLRKTEASPRISMTGVATPWPGNLARYVQEHRYPVDRSRLGDAAWKLDDTRVQDLVSRLQQGTTPLAPFVMGEIQAGAQPACEEAFVIDRKTRDRMVAADTKSAAIILPLVAGNDIRRYETPSRTAQYLISSRAGIPLRKYRAVFRHLQRYRPVLVQYYEREEGRNPGSYRWYDLPGAAETPPGTPGILFTGIAGKMRFTLDEQGCWCGPSCARIGSGSRYLLGILNSRLMDFVARHTLTVTGGAYRKYQAPAFEKLPVYVPDFDDPVQAALHDRLEALVGEIMRVKNRITEQRAGEEDAGIMQKARDLDRQIDAVVYRLYGLTEDEIALVGDKAGDSPC
ncbi:MAG: hypothetical protein WC382_05770 [Methanoregulaceae archaeon]|jgi:hypothetical protein